MKVTAVLIQTVEFDEKVDLSKIKNTDDWDELLQTKAAVIDTHIKDIKQEAPKCPKCGHELRAIQVDAQEEPILFCSECREAFTKEDPE